MSTALPAPLEPTGGPRWRQRAAAHPVLVTTGTMLVSVAALCVWFPPLVSLGFMLLLLAHEMGHWVAMRRYGLQPSMPVFIPFLGAVVVARSLGRSATTEAVVGLAGPVAGTLATALLLPLAAATDSETLVRIIVLSFALNLFNLLPVSPLDGGRAAAALSPWVWVLGMIVMAGLAVWLTSPVLGLLALVAVSSSVSRLRARRAEAAYYAIPLAHRIAVGGTYVGLAVMLVGGIVLAVGLR